MDAARPSTVQVMFAPITVPATGVAQVPWVTPAAEFQVNAPAAERTSYLAGRPVPSLT